MTPKFLVRFSDVGRDKTCWEDRIGRPVDDVKVIRAIKKRKILASRDIDIDWGGSDYSGTIPASRRSVGRVLIVPGSEQ